MGFPVEETLEIVAALADHARVPQLLFSEVVPNVKRLGLLTPWLRERFHELDILQFEDLPADA